MSQVELLEKVDSTKHRGLGGIEVSSGNKRLRLPLKSVDVAGRVVNRLAHVTVTETFSNPFGEHLEAVYIFPLSGGCAVSSFEMRVGERVIKGVVEERSAARAQYAEALQDGKRAALLEQEREDIFTVQVGNLPPDEEITVVITYSEKLPYFEDGTTEIRLPLVVAPRYIPGQAVDRESVGDGTELDTDQVPDASRITPPRIAKGADAKIALSLKVVIAGDETIEDLACSQHATKMGTSKDGVTIALSREDELLNRDFVLRWRVATDKVQSKFLLYKNPQSKDEYYGMLSLVPPKCTDIVSAPRDLIFVVDRSGSMNGMKMVSAARACSYLLSTLSPRDRFAIQAFDTDFEWMPSTGSQDKFIASDETGIQQGMNYLRTITARGGTELGQAIGLSILAMQQRCKTAGRQPVVVVLTDGEVGNESQILSRIQTMLGDLRVFTIGIDTAVNDGFLRKLAALGGGTATFVEPGTQLENALGQVSREIGSPLIESLSIADVNCGLDARTVTPESLPDLFEGRAVSTFFRLNSPSLERLTDAKIIVRGKFADGAMFDQEISAQGTDVLALPQLWAKSHIVDLEDKFRIASEADKTKLQKQIVEIARRHSILTKFTAFVVVDESEIVNANGKIRKIVQPVETPDLWKEELRASIRRKVRFADADAEWGGAAGHFDMPAPSTNLGISSAGKMQRAMSQSSPAQAPVPPTAAPKPGAPASDALSSLSEHEGGAATPGQPPQSTPHLRKDASGMNMPARSAGSSFNFLGSADEKSKAGGGLTGYGSPARAEESVNKKSTDGSTSDNTSEVKMALNRLAKVLADCFKQIEDGKVPDPRELESARLELLGALSQSSLASSIPALQKYLRADLVKLIAAIAGANVINQQLKTLSISQQKCFQSLQTDSIDLIDSAGEKPFWTATV